MRITAGKPGVLLAVALTAVAAATVVGAAHASFPGRNGRLAWSGTFGGCSEIRTLTRDYSREIPVFSTCRGGLSAPVFSPDGRRLLFGVYGVAPNASGIVSSIQVGGDHLRRLPVTGFDPAWSPDARHIAYVDTYYENGTIWRARLDGTHRRALATDGARPRWSPDGRTIAHLTYLPMTVFAGGEIRLVSARDGRALRVLAQTVGPFDFSPTGRHLVYGRGSPPCGMYIVRTDGPGEARRLPDVPCYADSVAWSPDGSRIAYVTRSWDEEEPSEEIWLTPVAAGRPKRVYSSHEGNVDEPVRGLLSWQALRRHR